MDQLPVCCPPGALLEALADQPDPAILESTALHPQYGRYSILACRPIDVLTLRDGDLRDSAGRPLASDDDGLWARLGGAFSAVNIVNRPARPEYLPGWIGWIGYEVGRHVEVLPGKATRDTHLPDMRLAFYDALLVYDALEQSWRLVNLVFDSPPQGAGQAAGVLRTIAASATGDHPAPAPVEQTDAAFRPTPHDAHPNFTPDEYQQAVARCIEYIAAGDIFQVNLSQRFAVDDAPPSLAIYRALRRRNPAWYSAYLSFDAAGRQGAVISSSPELFLRLRGDSVVTRPIKGTRPRVGDEAADAAAAAELLASEKDNAELAMIIDLLRNDLGRVCRFGSVRVTEPRRLETHPTVFHLVGTVEGRLRSDVGPAELLRATFPGGSITGAPKIRAMEIIDEIEPVARGPYTGCIGWVGVDGSCEWNIVIRTVVADGSRAMVQAGGGIVADSLPSAEYAETLDKARALLEAIEEARTTATTPA